MTGFRHDLTAVGSILRGMPVAPRIDDRLAATRDVWRAAAGAAPSKHAYPMRIGRDGTLVVHCSSSTWAAELTLLASHLQARLDELLGEAAPTALRFRVGELPEAPADAVAAGPRSVNPRAAELAREVADPALRAAIERAIAVRSGAAS